MPSFAAWSAAITAGLAPEALSLRKFRVGRFRVEILVRGTFMADHPSRASIQSRPTSVLAIPDGKSKGATLSRALRQRAGNIVTGVRHNKTPD
jgi:hypothetical protein